MAGCCAATPDSDSQPAPVVPAQTSTQNQVSLLAPAMVAWILPSHEANLISSASVSPLMATGTPLYARNCALLL
jgi:hypothetical protein